VSAYVKGLIVVALVVTGIGFWYSQNKERLTFQTTPKQYSLLDKMEKEGVPPFELPRTDGEKFSLAEVQGKIVIVNFWASWCNPCVQEFPSFIELINRFKGDIVLVAVSTDEVRDDMNVFLKAFGLPKPNIYMLWDKDRAIADRYGVGKIPESFLIGRDGKLLRKVAGIDNWATPEAIAFFEDLLKK
jgi:thiol-disulfide isomerase/thioredoxin